MSDSTPNSSGASADALKAIARHSRDGAALREKFFADSARTVDAAAFICALALARSCKILLCGNGGSAADCQHVAAEFVNRFLIERPALPAIALTTDTSGLTAIGNDRSFDQSFARQVEAYGAPGDVLIAISTSGGSPNVLAAMEAAKAKGMTVIGLTGQNRQGHPMAFADILICVPDKRTPLIQETHLAIEHLLCQLVDHYLFENPTRIANALKSPGEGDENAHI